MIKLLYGTGNPAKLSAMQKRLKELGIELIRLKDLISYYSNLARQYGNLTARYKNAICLVINEENIYEAMTPSMEIERFLITEKPNHIFKKGFPLDSLSIDIKSGKNSFFLFFVINRVVSETGACKKCERDYLKLLNYQKMMMTN